MKKIKYYHSKPIAIVNLPAIVDSHGEIMFVSDQLQQPRMNVPRVTVASIYDDKENRIYFGSAVCSTKDTYNRKFGNELALSRALSRPELTVIPRSRKNIAKDSVKYVDALMLKHLPNYVQSCI